MWHSATQGSGVLPHKKRFAAFYPLFALEVLLPQISVERVGTEVEMANPKVLIVDDDQDFVAGLRLVLENQRYEVLAAHDREDGLRRLRDSDPDIILLDILMGKGADGILFARKVRQDPDFARFAKTPILVMTSMRQQTGFFFPGEPKHPVFFPIDALVEKPIKPAELLEKVSGMLEAKTA